MPSTAAQEQANHLLRQRDAITEEELHQSVRILLANAGEDDLVFVLLQLLKRIQELETQGETKPVSPSTPSGMIPPYEKPTVPSAQQKGKKPGKTKCRDGKNPAMRDRAAPHHRASITRSPIVWSSARNAEGRSSAARANPAFASASSKTFPNGSNRK